MSTQVGKQNERSFYHAYRLHLTTRPFSQVVGAIRESPLTTYEEFVKESFEVRPVRFRRAQALGVHPLVTVNARLTMPPCGMRRRSTL
eukprot:5716889-Prymnesium_polylepis.1